MSAVFFKLKMICRNDFGGGFASHRQCFPTAAVSLKPDFSCRAQVGQPFQVPTDAFELQLQSVAFMSDIPHPPGACAPLPPAEHFLNLAAIKLNSR
jgi:hypothetical protein